MNRQRTSGSLVVAAALLAVGPACIKTGNVVIVDRKTALEQQAAGSYRGLEDELARAGVTPGPAPLTRAELEASGAAGGERALTDDEIASDAATIDDLLVRRCIGEALDGTLVETAATCTGGEPPRLARLVERTNRQRWQVWRWLQSKRPGASLDDVRRAWREVHLRGVVCAGQVQRADGAWETKKC